MRALRSVHTAQTEVLTSRKTIYRRVRCPAAVDIFGHLRNVGLQIRRAQLFPEHVERKFDDEEQDSTAGREPEHFGQEARVEGAEAFLARDQGERRERPVVFRSLAGDLMDRSVLRHRGVVVVVVVVDRESGIRGGRKEGNEEVDCGVWGDAEDHTRGERRVMYGLVLADNRNLKRRRRGKAVR